MDTSRGFSSGAIVISVILAVSSFFLPSFQMSGGIFLTMIPALACIILTALSLFYISSNSFWISSDSTMLTAGYLLLAFSCSSAISFSDYHLVALLLAWSVFFGVKYVSSEKNILGYFFVSNLILAVCTLIIPRMVWLLPISFLMAYHKRSNSFLKNFLSFLAAIALPLIYLFSFRYLFSNLDMTAFFRDYRNLLSDVNFSFGREDLVQLFFDAVLILLFLRSALHAIVGQSGKKHSSLVLQGYSLVYSSCIMLIVFLYAQNTGTALRVMVYVPFSILIFGFLSDRKAKKESRAFLLLLIVISVVLRVSEFLK